MPSKRNIGILAHIDAGKTTLTEQVLFHTGRIRRIGTVEDGSTVTDWAVQEQERGITIGSAAVTVRHEAAEVTLVDTPGHVDFTIEVERCLTVLDGAVLVISGPDGVQAQTRTVTHQATRARVPLLGFINKLDRPGFVDDALHEAIRDDLGMEPVPLQMPLDVGQEQIVLLDLLEGVVRTWTDGTERARGASPATIRPMNDEESVLRDLGLERVVNAVADGDDRLAEAFLSGEPLTTDMLIPAIQRKMFSGECLPLIYGAARAGVGVSELFDGIVGLLPSPDQAPSPPSYALADTPDGLGVGADGVPVAAFVFKTERRTGGRRVSWVRVFSGEIRAGQPLIRWPEGRAYTPTETVQIMGGWEEPVPGLLAGDVGALIHEEDVEAPITGETLGGGGLSRVYERILVPSPVVSVSIEAEDAPQDLRMRAALARQVADDPSLAVWVDPQTGQTLLAGMGELHLEIALERLDREGIGCRHSVPAVRHRQVITEAAAVSMTSPPRAGTATAELAIAISPRSDLANDVRFDVTRPRRVDWQEALTSGLEAGLDGAEGADVVGVNIAVTRWELRGGDGGARALYDLARQIADRAVHAAAPRMAEPWMSLAILVPNESVGVITGDVARRRGRVRGSSARGGLQELRAEGPLSELLSYATDLRSMTGGRGTFTMEPLGYRPLDLQEASGR